MAEIITTADKPITLWVFYSHIKSQSFIFPNGEKADFVNGKYYTSDAGLAEILHKEVARGNKVFYVKKGEETIQSDDLDPEVKLKKKLRAELMAEFLEQGLIVSAAQSPDTGESKQGKLNAASTTDIASVAAGGDGASMGVRLAALANASKANGE